MFKYCSCFADNSSPIEKELNYLLGKDKLGSIESQYFGQAALCRSTFIKRSKSYEELRDYGLFIPNTNIPRAKQQSYPAWKVMLDLNSSWKRLKKKKIYIVPLEELPDFVIDFKTESGKSFLTFLKEFVSIYYLGCEVEILDPLNNIENEWHVKNRVHKLTGQKQYLATDLNNELVKVFPKDGSCIMGLSWIDLYPTEDLNFELGESCFQKGTGVFSFGRFRPKLFEDGNVPPTVTAITGPVLYQMLRVLSHEIGHLYGLQHCVFFECAMNESTSMEQALGQPLFLCPVCLRRVYKICNFSLFERYKALQDFLLELNRTFKIEKIETAISWLQKSLDVLQSFKQTEIV